MGSSVKIYFIISGLLMFPLITLELVNVLYCSTNNGEFSNILVSQNTEDLVANLGDISCFGNLTLNVSSYKAHAVNTQ